LRTSKLDLKNWFNIQKLLFGKKIKKIPNFRSQNFLKKVHKIISKWQKKKDPNLFFKGFLEEQTKKKVYFC